MKRIIISGGGTGGHIFPAISIADALKASGTECEILFVGAQGKMEMERVPKAGYKIIGLPVAGLQRKLTLKNLALPFKLLASNVKARKIIRDFKPDDVRHAGASGIFLCHLDGGGIDVAARDTILALILLCPRRFLCPDPDGPVDLRPAHGGESPADPRRDVPRDQRGFNRDGPAAAEGVAEILPSPVA